MNDALQQLARELALDAPAQAHLRYAFGHACAQRVRHLLEDTAVIACLDGLGQVVQGKADDAHRQQLAQQAAQLANHHPGSRSLDGVGHAAVSASYAVAQALAGKALAAADYAAYATVYGQGGYGAVADLQSFAPEHAWQVRTLGALAAREVRA